MATATREPIPEDKPTLTPVLAESCALRLRDVLVCALVGGFFLFLNHLPLWHTDLWGHVAYGKWILDHRALPTEDPFMPLAEGMRVIDYAWLAQVILAQITIWLGPEWLSNIFAAVVLLTYLVLARALYLRSGRLALTLLGTFLALAVGWSRLSTLRPETFGALCFALLLWLLVSESARAKADGTAARLESGLTTRRVWLIIPVLFAVWANLHGSFLCGLAVLACCTTGRLLEVVGQTRSVAFLLHDRPLRRWLLLSELAFGATLINPYGMDLLIYCVRFANNGNLRDVVEWFPLVLHSPTGFAFGLSCVLLGVALRFSRRRFSAAEVLLWGVFAVASICSVRMIGWYAVVVALVLAPHFKDIYDRIMQRVLAEDGGQQRSPARTSFRYTLVCLLFVWMSFAFSGWGRPVLGRAARPSEALYSALTPRGASAFLRENPPEGQIFNPQWWGDWLVWDGPSGLQPFVTTNVHLAPRRVWKDYVRIANVQPGWQSALDRYRVTTVVVDKNRQSVFTPVIRRDPEWTVQYEDELALVLQRRRESAGSPSDEGDVQQRNEEEMAANERQFAPR